MNEHDAILKKQIRSAYQEHGISAMSDKEILILVLTYTAAGGYEKTADELLGRFKNLSAISDADPAVLAKIEGIDEKSVVFFKLIPQLSRRYFMEERRLGALNSSSAAREYFRNYFIGASEEQFAAACLDEEFNIIESKTLFSGSSSAVDISCRRIIEFVLRNNCSQIIIAHNHPVGSAEPSAGDYNTTNTIYLALSKLGIALVDHIVTAKQTAVSMQELPVLLKFKQNRILGYDIAANNSLQI